MVTKNPSKQRKALYQAPLHIRQKLIHAHLSPDLRRQYRKRSLGVRVGDEVKVLRGKYKGKIAKISKVDLKKLFVNIEGLKRKKVSGEETNMKFHTSNLIIISCSMDDKKRKKSIERVRK